MDIIKLCVWDFDGTLVEIPTASLENKKKWADFYKKPWPYTGWWDQDESLNSLVWKMPVIQKVYNAYKTESMDIRTANVLLTGRPRKHENIVKHIVNNRGYYFDHYLFSTGGATLQNKITHLDQLLSSYLSVRNVELWDDRKEHFNAFEEWGYKLKATNRIDSFCLNKIESERWDDLSII